MVNMPSSEDLSSEFSCLSKKWALLALIDLGAHNAIIQDDYCVEPGLLRALGIDVALIDEYEKAQTLKALKALRDHAVKKDPVSSCVDRHQQIERTSNLEQNIEWLGKQVSLTEDDKRVLLFCVTVRQNLFLNQAIAALGSLSTTRILSVLSILLEIPLPRVYRALSEDSGLLQAGILTIDHNSHFEFNHKIDILTGLPDQLMLKQQNLFFLFASNFVVAPEPKLTVDQFAYLGPKVGYLSKYLSIVVSQQSRGVNILIYGRSGTGKTELSRALAKQLNLELFEVAVEGSRGTQISGKDRLASYRLSQRILAKRSNALLIFDEIEDITSVDEDDWAFDKGNRSGQKGFLNRLLQENTVPTIWITNNLRPLDPAHLRRFDYCLQMDMPPQRVRSAMLADCVQGLDVSPEWCASTATHSALSPALMTRATKVASAMLEAGADASIEVLLNDVIDSALKVQSGDRPLTRVQVNTFKYQLDALNTDCSLDDVMTGLASCGQGRLCLYGPSGTGKSAYAQHVAKVLGKPVLVKRASDILGSFLGETESNMAAMFREATTDDAVLILDEADSFLREREGARRGWEITIVNEMLTQMEAFEGIFFATSNLMDHLDTASLRRFDMKINFGYLKFDQRLILTQSVCDALKLDPTPYLEECLQQLDQLTPGDFDNVLRQSRMRPIRAVTDLIDRLKQETRLKALSASRPIGF